MSVVPPYTSAGKSICISLSHLYRQYKERWPWRNGFRWPGSNRHHSEVVPSPPPEKQREIVRTGRGACEATGDDSSRYSVSSFRFVTLTPTATFQSRPSSCLGHRVGASAAPAVPRSLVGRSSLPPQNELQRVFDRPRKSQDLAPLLVQQRYIVTPARCLTRPSAGCVFFCVRPCSQASFLGSFIPEVAAQHPPLEPSRPWPPRVPLPPHPHSLRTQDRHLTMPRWPFHKPRSGSRPTSCPRPPRSN